MIYSLFYKMVQLKDESAKNLFSDNFGADLHIIYSRPSLWHAFKIVILINLWKREREREIEREINKPERKKIAKR